jgi:hypothetical protein
MDGEMPGKMKGALWGMSTFTDLDLKKFLKRKIIRILYTMDAVLN